MYVLHFPLTWISGCKAWHTKQPRPKLPPVPPSYSVQECTYVFRLVLGLGDQTYGWFTLLPPYSLLSQAVFLCPWETAQSKVRTLLKVHPRLLCLWASAALWQRTEFTDVERQWHLRGERECSHPNAAAVTHSDISAWVYNKMVKITRSQQKVHTQVHCCYQDWPEWA